MPIKIVELETLDIRFPTSRALRLANKRAFITGLINAALALAVVAAVDRVSVMALIAIFFFMSIMFPTIFALAVKNLGAQTERGSSYLIMSIVGGAIVPYFMGLIADARGIAVAYLIPAACFAVVAAYGWKADTRWSG